MVPVAMGWLLSDILVVGAVLSWRKVVWDLWRRGIKGLVVGSRDLVVGMGRRWWMRMRDGSIEQFGERAAREARFYIELEQAEA